jgi:hypothetical protein
MSLELKLDPTPPSTALECAWPSLEHLFFGCQAPKQYEIHVYKLSRFFFKSEFSGVGIVYPKKKGVWSRSANTWHFWHYVLGHIFFIPGSNIDHLINFKTSMFTISQWGHLCLWYHKLKIKILRKIQEIMLGIN